MAAELLPPSLVQAIGWTLIDTLWQGALVVLGYALARAASRRARARVFIGHVALASLVGLATASFWFHLGRDVMPEAWVPLGLVAEAAIAIGPDVAADAGPGWLHWLVLAWAAGVMLHSLRLVHQGWRLRRWCAQAQPLAPEWQRRFLRLRARLGVLRPVRLLQSVQVATPLLVGAWRPVVLLPASLVARLPADQLELVLLHELAHLRRLDPWFNLLQTAIDTVLFYHPAVRWLSRRVREDRELCCDELVLAAGGDRLGYARALLALAEQSVPAAPAAALAATGGALLERVEHLVEVPPERRAVRPRIVPVWLLVGALALALWGIAREREASHALASIAPSMLGLWTAPAERIAPAPLRVGDLAPLRVARPAWEPVRAEAEDVGADIETRSPAPPPIAMREDASLFAAATASPAPPAREASPQPEARETTSPARVAEIPDSAEIADTGTRPVPRRAVMPEYPRAARVEGIEGWVRLAYRIDAAGRVTDVSVLASQPAGVFEAAAQRALQRWRFDRDAAGIARQQQFDFVLPAAAAGEARDASGRCLRRTGSRLCQGGAPDDARVRLGAD
jgi:bla regulator protein BlaR1